MVITKDLGLSQSTWDSTTEKQSCNLLHGPIVSWVVHWKESRWILRNLHTQKICCIPTSSKPNIENQEIQLQASLEYFSSELKNQSINSIKRWLYVESIRYMHTWQEVKEKAAKQCCNNAERLHRLGCLCWRYSKGSRSTHQTTWMAKTIDSASTFENINWPNLSLKPHLLSKHLSHCPPLDCPSR